MARFLLLKDQKSKPHETINYRRVIDWNWYFTLKSLWYSWFDILDLMFLSNVQFFLYVI